MSVVQAEGVTFTYPGNEDPTLNNVSFAIEPGEVVGLIGPLGAGKTTLCMAIAGFVPSVTGGHTRGQITVGDRDAQAASSNDDSDDLEDDLVQRVGVVFEDYGAQIIQLQVLEEVFTPLKDRGLSSEEATSHARELLSQVGLADRNLENRRVWELSGGEQLRLALAAVLAIDPPVLVLDNVLDKLDPQEQQRVIQLVRDLQGEKTFVIVEQNITLIQDLCDRLLVLVAGEVIEAGDTDDVLRNQDTLSRADTLPPMPLRVARDLGLAEKPLTFDALKQHIEARQNGHHGQRASQEQKYHHPSDSQQHGNDGAWDGHFGQPVLQVQNVAYCYGNGGNPAQALDDVSITVRQGEVHGVIGRSGAGKTTLVQLIAGLLPPTNGKIAIGDVETTQQSVPELASRVGTVLQRPDDQLSEKTVGEEIVFPLKQRNRRGDRYEDDYIEAQRSQICELLGIGEDLMDEDPFLLSWGQRKRVVIAEVLTTDPEVLILDEPSVGAGATSRQKIYQVINELRNQGKAVLMTGNDIDFITGIADSITILDQGRVILQGTVQSVFAAENWNQLSERHLQPPSAARLSRQIGFNAVKYDELVSQLASR